MSAGAALRSRSRSPAQPNQTHFPFQVCFVSRHVASNALLALAGLDHSVFRSSTRRAYIFATIAGFVAATLLCSVQSPPAPLPTL